MHREAVWMRTHGPWLYIVVPQSGRKRSRYIDPESPFRESALQRLV
jgi:hypothetical protein